MTRKQHLACAALRMSADTDDQHKLSPHMARWAAGEIERLDEECQRLRRELYGPALRTDAAADEARK